MKKIVLALFLLPLLAFQSTKLVKTKFTEEISGLLPESFLVMSTEEVIRRLPSARTPLVAYTDESRILDFSINTSATQWAQADLKLAKDFYKASIYNLYDEVKMIREEMKEINGREFAVFEFESLINGDGLTKKSVRKYTYIQYTIKDHKMYVFAFNGPVQLREKWQTTVAEMMDNVKMK